MVRASPPPGKIFGALIEEVRFAADSLLDGDGFELLVPPRRNSHRGAPSGFRVAPPARISTDSERDEKFESGSQAASQQQIVPALSFDGAADSL
jgi:hypothetical protein